MKTAVILLFAVNIGLYSQTKNQRNISEVLNYDGSIRAGLQGSFDAKGFQMQYDDKGAPLFFPPDSGYWDPIGGMSGLNNDVWAIAVSGSDVYLGGLFTDAGGNGNADYVANGMAQVGRLWERE